MAAAAAAALAVSSLAANLMVQSTTEAASAVVPLSISVSRNHFIDGSGHVVRLLGVNHPSFEYACQQGWGYNDGMMDDADATAIAAWHATAVRIPLNEDCWLGINGMPDNTQGEPLTVAGYRRAVVDYVNALHAHGLYAILDLHWTAPYTVVADGQRAMPDNHSAAFWTSVATKFKADHAVVFDAFNEPYSPAKVNDPTHPVSWNCWRDGGCQVPRRNDNQPRGGLTYPAVGMQAMVDAIRNTGATQPILLGGLSYANDLSGWLSHKPSDPLNQLAASFHNYQGEDCDNITCWRTFIAPIRASVPVVAGEFDEDVCTPTTFDRDFMNWADGAGVGYLAWGWWVLTPEEINDAGCSAYYLITDPSGTPAVPNGTALHNHLALLPVDGADVDVEGGVEGGDGGTRTGL
jgi:endoglucanase